MEKSEKEVSTSKPTEPETSPAAPASQTPNKVIVTFKASSGAPQLVDKAKKVKVDGSRTMKDIMDHLKKILKLESEVSIFLYLASAHFSPSLDQGLGNLALAFGRQETKGVFLDIEYSLTPAYG
eukprot:m.80392 g.80392  ORF g.80392 m.80392 type:complete len:124 (-) comp12755_c0_seq2:5827-6198(-)